MSIISVPSFGPMGVEANATSSTTIVVRWGDVPKEHQNGQIEGFKVYYGSNPRLPFQVCIAFWVVGACAHTICSFVLRKKINTVFGV
jgi:hypothetical protein